MAPVQVCPVGDNDGFSQSLSAPLPEALGLRPFRPRCPWLNGDLQTLRDSLRPVALPPAEGLRVEIPVPCLGVGTGMSSGRVRDAVGGSHRRVAGAAEGVAETASKRASTDALGDAAPDGGASAGGANGAGGVAAEAASGAMDRLLAFLDQPLVHSANPFGLVVLMHGLGGSSDREGLRRMGLTLQRAGFAVLRLNMRGAGPGRTLARGTYAARCNSDLLPALRRARELADGLAPGGRPLFGMGISLGGTKLLNALVADAHQHAAAGLNRPVLDGLVCISSPLDLEECSRQIERPRNRVYERWLLKRLLAQTAADPFGVSAEEQQVLNGGGQAGPLRSIRAFDAAITAPRWGYDSVDAYYGAASPLPRILAIADQLTTAEPGAPAHTHLPPALIVHAADDPWVPVSSTERLAASALAAEQGGPWQVLITPKGGHNGFHAACDTPGGQDGNWGDRLTARWLQRLAGGLVGR